MSYGEHRGWKQKASLEQGMPETKDFCNCPQR